MLRYLFRNLERLLIAVLLAAMTAMVFAGVVSRYVLHQSLSYMEELVRYLFVWSTFLGAAAATQRRAHLGMSYLSDRLSETWRRRLDYFVGAATLGFFACLGILGGQTVRLQCETGQTTAALGWPMWWVGISVPVGSLLVIVRVIGCWLEPAEEAEGER